jgi:hypothetical protein
MKPKTSDRAEFVAWMGESVKSYAPISEEKEAELLKIILSPMTIKEICDDFAESKAVTRAACFRLVAAGKLDFATKAINKSIYFNALTFGSAYVFFPSSYQPPLNILRLQPSGPAPIGHQLSSRERLSEKCFDFMANNDGAIAIHHDGRLKINFSGSIGDKLRIMAAINEVLKQ